MGKTRSPTQRNAVGIKILFSDIYAKELLLIKFVKLAYKNWKKMISGKFYSQEQKVYTNLVTL